MKYVGNCSNIIDWNQVIADIEHQTPTYIGPSHKEGDPIPGLDEVTDMWKRAGLVTVHNGGTVGWDMFVSGKSFDERIVEKFLDFVGLESYTTCWISRIHIGCMAAWHWDVNDREVELAKEPEKRRFHCHISKPAFGHALMIDDKLLYNQEQGAVYEWPSRKSWHAGANCGLVPKYLFNLW